MIAIELVDYKGDYWEFRLPSVYKRNKLGLTVMCVQVVEGPQELKGYSQVPLPVFTEWWA